jgi:hypothetical protein
LPPLLSPQSKPIMICLEKVEFSAVIFKEDSKTVHPAAASEKSVGEFYFEF